VGVEATGSAAATSDDSGGAPELQADPVQASDFLREEYDALVSLYTHTENTLFSLFNFYLTLLSAITGGIIVLAQINNSNIAAALPAFGFLLVFAVLLGIITQSAIINKNADLAHYALSLNLLKDYALRNAPDARRRVFYLHNMLTPVSPIELDTRFDRIQTRIWWMLPLGTHQLFVSVVNSLALSVATVILILIVAGPMVPPWQWFLGGVFMVVMSFIAHAVYARKKFELGMRQSRLTISGGPPSW
jgi:hypothetical protein